jgi:hypothetical protein
MILAVVEENQDGACRGEETFVLSSFEAPFTLAVEKIFHHLLSLNYHLCNQIAEEFEKNRK